MFVNLIANCKCRSEDLIANSKNISLKDYCNRLFPVLLRIESQQFLQNRMKL